MVTASYQSSLGDSGGVVKAVWGSSTYAIGIHSGRVGTGYGNAFFSDMNWAKNDLGFGGYYD